MVLAATAARGSAVDRTLLNPSLGPLPPDVFSVCPLPLGRSSRHAEVQAEYRSELVSRKGPVYVLLPGVCDRFNRVLPGIFQYRG